VVPSNPLPLSAFSFVLLWSVVCGLWSVVSGLVCFLHSTFSILHSPCVPASLRLPAPFSFQLCFVVVSSLWSVVSGPWSVVCGFGFRVLSAFYILHSAFPLRPCVPVSLRLPAPFSFQLCFVVVSGQWSVVSGPWSVVSGLWSVVSSQWSVVRLQPLPYCYERNSTGAFSAMIQMAKLNPSATIESEYMWCRALGRCFLGIGMGNWNGN